MSATEPHIGDHARQAPDRPAVVMSDGSPGLTYAELDRRSNALAGQLAAAGVRAGDVVAILAPNSPDFLVAAWAAQRSGLYYVPVNWHLTPEEAGYIITDSGAGMVLTTPDLARITPSELQVEIWLSGADGDSGFAPAGRSAPGPVAYEPLDGSSMLYSSGTSGRPKGVKRPLSQQPFGALNTGDHMLRGLYGWSPATVLLCTAPLYHAAPMNFCMSVHRLGGVVVLMPSFDAAEALEAVSRHAVTSVWLVPTMMIQMLNLPYALRAGARLESLTHAIHSGAPCPVPVKKAMIDWWGPRVFEFYSATEGVGFTAISPQEWLARPGSVGRSDEIRIVGEDGEVVAPGTVGTVYFASVWTPFDYHNDADKTVQTRDPRGWITLGDMGRVDAEGWLYLTDRKSHMIISGGVNIYPQEAENLLASHPAVADVAVIGVPDPEYGEQVKAVIVLRAGHSGDAAMQAVLIAACRQGLARYKCPRTVDFVDALPRLPSGKMLKRELRARYWPADPLRGGDVV